jgi:hypothetical protein
MRDLGSLSGISAYETEGAGCEREDFWPIVAIEGAKVGQKSGSVKEPAKQVVKEIRRATISLQFAEPRRNISQRRRGGWKIAAFARESGCQAIWGGADQAYRLSCVVALASCGPIILEGTRQQT